MDARKPLIIIAGPTAVGKTAFSIRLAQEIGGEIVSADSAQVYRGMDIGSAKITPEQMQGVAHHLIDILEPDEPFSVYRFQEEALRAMRERIYPAGHIPVITGGTGFYIQSVLYEIDFSQAEEQTAYRLHLQEIADRPDGAAQLYRKLCEVDAAYAQTVHQNNVRRVMRALEYYYETGGERLSEHNSSQRERQSPYNFAYFVLTMNRRRLYEQIDRRVELMFENGLTDEVEALRRRGCTRDMASMKGIGYKEVLAYLDGECGYGEAVETVKRNTRHFAKRQLTWFRREREVVWLDKDELDADEKLVDRAMDICRTKGIIE